MSSRIIRFLFLLILIVPQIFVPQIQAKDKKKQLLPEVVLQAQRVLVVIHPDASEAMTNPWANRTARDEVEQAITKWGRFDVVTDKNAAQLIIAIQKGKKNGATVSHSPLDKRPDSDLPSIADASAGPLQRGPALTAPPPDGMGNRGPQLGAQVIPSDDTFEVYLTSGDYPLDAAPVWRYIAKDALNAPQLAAVKQFRRQSRNQKAAPAQALSCRQL